MEDCPKCLGTGEVFTHSKLRKCNLCEGEKIIENDLAEDYVNSLKVFDHDH